MSRRKSIVVEYDLSRKGWSIKLQGTDSAARMEIIEAVETASKRHNLMLINAKPAFGEQPAKKERKKTVKTDEKTAERSEQANQAQQAGIAHANLPH